MSIWAEIKYAINSTLGKPNFKPIDQIFDECCGVFASDNVLYNIGTAYEDTRTETKVLKMTGTIRVKAELTMGDSLSVWLNGTFVGRVTFGSIQAGYSYPTINIKYGDEITFSGSGGNGRNVQICGTTYFAPRGGIIE